MNYDVKKTLKCWYNDFPMVQGIINLFKKEHEKVLLYNTIDEVIEKYSEEIFFHVCRVYMKRELDYSEMLIDLNIISVTKEPQFQPIFIDKIIHDNTELLKDIDKFILGNKLK